MLTVADVKTISQTFKSEQQMMERQRKWDRDKALKDMNENTKTLVGGMDEWKDSFV